MDIIHTLPETIETSNKLSLIIFLFKIKKLLNLYIGELVIIFML